MNTSSNKENCISQKIKKNEKIALIPMKTVYKDSTNRHHDKNGKKWLNCVFSYLLLRVHVNDGCGLLLHAMNIDRSALKLFC